MYAEPERDQNMWTVEAIGVQAVREQDEMCLKDRYTVESGRWWMSSWDVFRKRCSRQVDKKGRRGGMAFVHLGRSRKKSETQTSAHDAGTPGAFGQRLLLSTRFTKDSRIISAYVHCPYLRNYTLFSVPPHVPSPYDPTTPLPTTRQTQSISNKSVKSGFCRMTSRTPHDKERSLLD